MSVADNIERVFQKIGTQVNVIKHDGSDPTAEYIDYETEMNNTTPFQDQFMIECTFSASTNAIPGDIIEFPDDNSKFIMVSGNKSRFRNKTVTVESVLYRCNVIGDIKRKQTSGRDNNYNLVETWNTVVSGESALLVGDINDRSVDIQEHSEVYITEPNLFLSGDVNVQNDDRFEITSFVTWQESDATWQGDDVTWQSDSEKYQIRSIEPRRLDNIKICRVQKDNRE